MSILFSHDGMYTNEPPKLVPRYTEEGWEGYEKQMADLINHPPHYTRGGIECLDFIESWGLDFVAGNVIKYVVRAPHKGNQVDDLLKARFYLDRLIKRAGGE